MSVIPGLVGRAAEQACLRTALDDLANGRGRSVLIGGEPGIGKSILLNAALEAGGPAPGGVLRGACDELGQKFPLLVMREILWRHGGGEGSVPGSAWGDADPAVPGSERTDPHGSVHLLLRGDPVAAAVERMLAKIDRLCAVGPVVLAVDDLHWADETSLLFWHRLSRATEQLPLLLIGTFRPVPQLERLELLQRELRGRPESLIMLDRLSEGETVQLTSQVLGLPAGPRLRARLQAAAGNPFYLLELVDALSRADALRAQGDTVEVVEGGDEVRGSLSAAIESRLDFISEDSMSVLRAATLLGPDFAVTHLAAVVGRTPVALVAILDELLAAGVLESVGSRMRFRHALIKQALYEALPGAVRSALHEQVAQVMIASGARVERTAQAVLAAPNSFSGWEVDWLVSKAGELADQAPAIAAELFSRALAHIDAGDGRRAVLEDHWAAVSFQLSRYDQTVALCRRIMEDTADPQRVGQAVWLLGFTLIRSGELDAAEDVLSRAIADIDAPPVWCARHTALLAMCLHTAGSAQAAQAAERALALGQQEQDRIATAYAHGQLVGVRARQRNLSGALAHLDEALRVIGDDNELTHLKMMLVCSRCGMLRMMDRFAEAGRMLPEAKIVAERVAMPSAMATIGFTAGMLSFELGQWDEVLSAAELDADLALPPWLAVSWAGLLGRVAAHRDDLAAVERELGPLDELVLDATTRGYAGFLLVARAQRAERGGRVREAADSLAPLLLHEYEEEMDDRHTLLPMLVRLALAAEDLELAQRAAASAASEAQRETTARKNADSQWCAGLVGGDPGLVQASADFYAATGRKPDAAAALEDAACLLAEAGEAEAALAAMDAAMARYSELGALWDLRRATQRARACGLRVGLRGWAKGRPISGPGALTETEQRVAGLVAQGQSNPDIAAHLFLSRRTVETHVSRILAKLQVRSRTEVAKALKSPESLAGG